MRITVNLPKILWTVYLIYNIEHMRRDLHELASPSPNQCKLQEPLK